ncbi:MAG: iron-sulfur cluster repair di-iron protein [Phycisphaerales bacterium]|nr:iron-sulfur cluster repair di-iron protein [Phycisphaerales bacterium]
MTSIAPESTVGQIVTENPDTARTLERLGLDYCCGGKLTLSAACAARGLDPAAVARELTAVAPSQGQRSWADATMSELADHIERAHHQPLRADLPRLAGLVDKVARVHGDREPALFEVRRVFTALAAEMMDHMDREERVLFPALRAMERGGAESPTDPALIAGMVHDHEDAGRALESLRSLTEDYTPPPQACNTYRVMLHALSEMDRDLRLHVHKENNILFPKAQRGAKHAN